MSPDADSMRFKLASNDVDVWALFRRIITFWKYLIFTKNHEKWPIVLGRPFPVSNFLLSVTSRHYSNDAKEADIRAHCGLPLNRC